MVGFYQLGFISDELIYQHVKATVSQYRRHINLKEFNQNIVDPIKLSFDAQVYGKSVEEIIEAECIRQIDKSNTNHIGYFHQNLFKLIGNGWEVPEQGYDIINTERHIYVELKNKHNTMNSSSATKTYSRMQDTILHDDEATCLLVEVISKKSTNEKWYNNGLSHRCIRKVSIDKFYSIVFGDDLAFYKLCKALPRILQDVMQEMQVSGIENSVYSELLQLSTDVQRSLYKLAFATYDGFEQL